MTRTVKTNGFKAEGIQEMIGIFEKALGTLFDNVIEIEHFYYEETLDMCAVYLPDGYHGFFHITKNRVSFTGYRCQLDDLLKFERLTHNDECYKNELMDIAGGQA